MSGRMPNASWLLVGGGLANCLLALRLENISADYLIVERGSQLAGQQTWSCQLSDIPVADHAFAKSIIDHQWPSYVVRFPDYERTLNAPYVTVCADRFRQRLISRIPAHKILLNTEVIHPEEFGKTHVVRATGFKPARAGAGFQKFVGWDVLFEKPHGLSTPALMDAKVTQTDGYRFFYLLPFDEHRVLIEDTRYSNSPELDQADFARGLKEYIHKKFKGPYRVERQEHGSLPIPWQQNISSHLFGVAGGYFHPSTGYSLPWAIAGSRELLQGVTAGHSVPATLEKMARAAAKHRGYYHLLNRMMFLAAQPEQRRKIFERFYTLNENFIRRFYAGQPTAWDKLRMLSGRPPVKVTHAIRAISQGVPAWT